jgi:flagellar basal-body rod protein FlgG
MRLVPVTSWLCWLSLAACQFSAPRGAATDPLAPRPGAIDGTFTRSGLPEERPRPVRRVVDPAVAQLIRAASCAHEAQRRAHFENLANADTVAYKRRSVRLCAQVIEVVDGEPLQLPTVAGIATDFSAGTLSPTQRALDIAIDGDGWLAVLQSDGCVGYTRDGRLQFDVDRRLVTFSGSVVQPEIRVPDDLLEIAIDPAGRVGGRVASAPDVNTGFGQLVLHRLANPDGLRRCANGEWRPSDESGAPISGRAGEAGFGAIRQGFCELANVRTADELLALQLLERRERAFGEVLESLGIIVP